MAITKKTEAEIAVLRKAGAVLADILRTLGKYAETNPGITTLDIDDLAQKLCEEKGVTPVLLGYHPTFAPVPFPAATCVSVNDIVQHGIPSETEVIDEGDVVNIDMSIGLTDGDITMVVDSGHTVVAGGADKAESEHIKLLAVTKEALGAGIAAARPGAHIGDISSAIQAVVERNGFSVVRELCGHGVGYSVHEEPHIPNYGKPGTGEKIEVGHVYAIEPIVNIGKPSVLFDDEGDGYTVYTEDGSWSAHFEHTVVITPDGAEILTKQ